VYDSDGSLTPELRRIYEASKESMQSKDRLVIDKIHNIVNINPESVGENMKYNGRVASQGG
jgi:hypothetical protein